MPRTNVKGLSEYTYETTDFQGYRVAVSHRGTTFVKYFSDKRHGSHKKAKRAALEALTRLRHEFETARLTRDNKMSKASKNRCRAILGLGKLPKEQ